MTQAQQPTRQRVYANVKFSDAFQKKTRFVKIVTTKKDLPYYRLVIADVGNAFLRPQDDGSYQATIRSRPMEGFHGKTAEQAWSKLAKHIGAYEEFPATVEPETPVKRVKAAAKPAKVVKTAAAKKASKKVVAVKKPGPSKKKVKITDDEFDFGSM